MWPPYPMSRPDDFDRLVATLSRLHRRQESPRRLRLAEKKCATDGTRAQHFVRAMVRPLNAIFGSRIAIAIIGSARQVEPSGFRSRLMLADGQAIAHPGGLASDSCHSDRKSGGRRCHRGSQASAPSLPPAQRLRKQSRTLPNCTAARAAGAAPVRGGDPGYARISIAMATGYAAKSDLRGGGAVKADVRRDLMAGGTLPVGT